MEYNANTFVGAINYLLEVISEGMDITVVKPDPDTEIDPDMSYPNIEVPSIHVEGLDEMWAAAGLVGESLSDTIKAMSALADTASGQGDTILDDIQDGSLPRSSGTCRRWWTDRPPGPGRFPVPWHR